MSNEERPNILTAAKTNVVVINTKIIEIEARLMELNLIYRDLLIERENAIQDVKNIKRFFDENLKHVPLDKSSVPPLKRTSNAYKKEVNNPDAGIPRYLSEIDKICENILSDYDDDVENTKTKE
jgi:succinate dehydrogenase/fumarate reductase-like Fe-S protein